MSLLPPMSSPKSPWTQGKHAVETILDPPVRATILVAAAAFHGLLLMGLSSRGRRSGNPVLRSFLWIASSVYLPLMSYVLSYLTSNIWSSLQDLDRVCLLLSVVLIQFLKAKADLAAMAVAASASPAAGDDDINSLKVRPSAETLIYSFWVAGLVVYNVITIKDNSTLVVVILLVMPLWILGACRMVLRFVAFQRATSSFALGRNVKLINGYIMQLQEAEGQLLAAGVPRLIVTGERNQDVEPSPSGYRVKRSSLEDKESKLITLDRVWSESDSRLLPEHKDICLSFAMFKCLRRQFAGHRLTEAGSSWAFRFIQDGLLGHKDDHERIFRVMATELTFARDFYYSALPVASLGTLSAALHFLLSLLIFSLLSFALLLVPVILVVLPIIGVLAMSQHDTSGEGNAAAAPSPNTKDEPHYFLAVVPYVLALVTACTEITEMVASVRSNWTKISIIGHFIRCRNRCARRIFSCLLKCCKPTKHWKDQMGQMDLLTKPRLLCQQQPCSTHIFQQIVVQWRNDRRHRKPLIKVPSEVKAAILRTFRSSDGKLSASIITATQQRCQAFRPDITWAFLSSDINTTTDAILVWCIATSLFEIECSARRASSSSSSSSSSAAPANILVAGCLSRYCTYLVAEAPDLLPDNSAWTKRRYQVVKEEVEAAQRHGGDDSEEGVYNHLIKCFGRERTNEVLKIGSNLGKRLVEVAAEPHISAEACAVDRGEDAVWKLLAECWSEMLLYLAPSDNVKGHIEVLQRGGELITLLWALLLHAGITSRPAHHGAEP